MSGNGKLFERLQHSDEQVKHLGFKGFLSITARKIRNIYQDRSASAWYQMEMVHPPFFDAVVLALYHKRPGSPPLVALRQGIRPSAALRADVPEFLALDGGPEAGYMWELPAGGVEQKDLAPGGAGVAGRASLEAWEETGLKVAAEELTPLGPAPFSAPAYCMERLYYFAAEVDPEDATTPAGDGHPMEEGSRVRFLPLDEALDWCRQGKIVDAKTEVGLRRLADHLE